MLRSNLSRGPARLVSLRNSFGGSQHISSHGSSIFQKKTLTVGLEIIAYTGVICVAAFDFYWETLSITFFALLQLYLFLANSPTDATETTLSTACTPYVSLGIAYVVVIWRNRLVAAIAPSVGLISLLPALFYR